MYLLNNLCDEMRGKHKALTLSTEEKITLYDSLSCDLNNSLFFISTIFT